MSANLTAPGGSAPVPRSDKPSGLAALTGWGPWVAFILIGVFLLAFLIVPVCLVIYTAFVTETGSLTFGHFANFFGQSVFMESFFNSLLVSLASVFFASVIAIPLAYLTVRFEFRGALLIQTLGVLPLIMPPFVGAVALQLIFGRSGSVNLLLDDWFGFTVPIMEGLTGVIFVESIHYFPFILLNLALSFQAAYAGPIIMMSQNRQGDKDRLAAAVDHEVNLKSELELSLLFKRVDDLEVQLRQHVDDAETRLTALGPSRQALPSED